MAGALGVALGGVASACSAEGVPLDLLETDATADAGGGVPPWNGDSGAPMGNDSGSNDGSTADVGTDTGTPLTGNHLVINEVDYDQPSGDDAEFVEIFNPTLNAIDLSDYEILLVNGSNNQIYETLGLSGMLPSGGYLVATSGTVSVAPGAMQVAFSQGAPFVQNGDPDAVGLRKKSAGVLVDALSYGGSVSTGGMNFVEGTATNAKDSNSAVGSLSRLPNGNDTDNAMSDWQFTGTPTPGAPNQ